MKITTIGKQSIRAILSNKRRSFLTILEIIIGIGSVIALTSLGNGVKTQITSQIQSLGTSMLTIMPGQGIPTSASLSSAKDQKTTMVSSFDSLSTLTIADYNALLDKQKNPDVALVSGSVLGSAIFNFSQRFSVSGVSESFFTMKNLSAQAGNIFTETDITAKNNVGVIGMDLATNLFGSESPIGKTLTIAQNDYTIIGLLAKAHENNFSNPNLNFYIPYSSAMVSFGTEKFNYITAQAINEDAVDKAKTEIQNTLLANHNITDANLADFNISTAADLLSTIGSITEIITSLLSGIASISLLVGGIGIMNIMLVSVTERTREIGLRKAVGAKTSDILIQFLLEAVLLTIIGGIFGIGLGFALGQAVGTILSLSPVVSGGLATLAVVISTIIGLVFGVYPAAKAARLNPIDALRYE